MDNLQVQDHRYLWEKMLSQLEKELSTVSIDRWFRHVQPAKIENGVLVLEVPDEFFKGWILDHYQEHIENALKSASPDLKSYEIVIVPRSMPETAPESVAPYQTGITHIANTRDLNQRYTFDEFVVGPSNRFAHAACLAVSEQPAKAYNPLFIYGPVGLGKTHLMQAIGNAVKKHDSNLNVLYITSEKFTNELINSIQNRTTLKFREKFRNVDILLIDDIHFIGGKEATQEEFFHTFNALHDNHKQIVISSDRPPKDINNLEERLVSRFEWGLVTDIQQADFETRAAILKKKAERESIEVNDQVIYFIAEKVRSNIRELEGALVRVLAYSQLIGKPVCLELTHEALRNYIQESEKKITVKTIQQVVSNYFTVKMADLSGKRRTKTLVFPRQIAMYLTRDLTELSLPEIGAAFGGRDHTTVLHACEKIKKLVDKDVDLKGVITRIRQSLNI